MLLRKVVVSDFGLEVKMLPFTCMHHDEMVKLLERVSRSIEYPTISAPAQ